MAANNKTSRPVTNRKPANRKTPAGNAAKSRPLATAAVATGAVAAVAAAGAYFFTRTETGRKAGKDIKAKASRIKTRAKAGAADLRDKAGEMTDKVKDGLTETGHRIKDAASRVRVRDGVDDVETA